MKYLFILFFGITIFFQSYGVKKTGSVTGGNGDCLIVYEDSSSGRKLFGYKTRDGEIVIPAKYQSVSDTLCKFAFVLDTNFRFLGINQKDSVILVPFIFDNGPDYLEEGLFRFVEHEKMGFANIDGEKIIQAKYSFADYFRDGLAEYFIGGEPVYEDGRTRSQIIQESGREALIDRHWNWGGDIRESGYLNKYGDEFEEVDELENGTRKALMKDEKLVILDADGRIIKSD